MIAKMYLLLQKKYTIGFLVPLEMTNWQWIKLKCISYFHQRALIKNLNQ